MSKIVTGGDRGELGCFVCIFTERFDNARLGTTVGCACVLFSVGYSCAAILFCLLLLWQLL